MPRLFAAIDLPEHIKDQVLELTHFGLSGVKWVGYGQFHLSLRFIGEVDQNLFESIGACLAKVRSEAFEIGLRGIGAFPSNKPPRVIWAGVEKNESLHQLRNKVEHQLNQIGIVAESRKFHPHVTLGRVKKAKLKRFGDYLFQNAMFKTEFFPVTEFILFSSKLTPKGAIYTKEIAYTLK